MGARQQCPPPASSSFCFLCQTQRLHQPLSCPSTAPWSLDSMIGTYPSFPKFEFGTYLWFTGQEWMVTFSLPRVASWDSLTLTFLTIISASYSWVSLCSSLKAGGSSFAPRPVANERHCQVQTQELLTPESPSLSHSLPLLQLSQAGASANTSLIIHTAASRTMI